MARKVIIFVPGYGCSKLVTEKSREVVWPDQVLNASGERVVRIIERNDLVADGTLLLMEQMKKDEKSSGQLIVMCTHIISFLTQYFDCTYVCNLEYLPQIPTNILIGFAYDWRRSLVKPAYELKALLDRVYQTYGPDSDIWLISHSMGPLVCRYVIESGIAQDVPWKLKGLISLGGAHLGTPLEISTIVGEAAAAFGVTPQMFEQENFFTQNQMRIFADWPGRPTAYQLLPPEHIVSVIQGGVGKVSIYDPTSPVHQILVAPQPEGFGADPESLLASQTFFSHLNYGSERNGRPDYYMVYGTSMRTALFLEYDPVVQKFTTTLGDGDGMIPTYSARFDGGWATERFMVQNVSHGDLLNSVAVLEQIRKWIV